MRYGGLAILLTIFYIFSPWLSFAKTLSSGDWPYLFLENVRGFSFWPQKEFLWLAPYYQIPAKFFVQYLGISWEITEKIFWFWPFVLLSIFSSYYLTKSWLGVLIYTTNTYVLMLVGGGQMGVGLAYSITPFVLGTFIKFINNLASAIRNFKLLILAGLVLGVQTMFDPRISYIMGIAILCYFLLNINRQKMRKVAIFIIPIIIAILANSYWMIPLLQAGFPAEVKGYTSSAGFQFFSFADFSHALSLLHPNWPENIFGKIYFLKPEFLLLPILAFSALLFLGKSKVKSQKFSNLIFFALLGLIGAFLAKGANPPFGEINSFLFQYFPGMNMFRDPTKFYILIILSYSVLIPFSLNQIAFYLKSKVKSQKLKLQLKIQNYQFVIYFLFSTFYLLILIRPAILGQLGGTFKPQVVPGEYVQFKDFLQNQQQSFKTFWVPSRQRFGFYSSAHPAISAEVYFASNDLVKILEELKKLDSEKQLQELSVRYLILPDDVEKELFITDRKYDEGKYNEVKGILETIPWLKKMEDFGKIAVFEVKSAK